MNPSVISKLVRVHPEPSESYSRPVLYLRTPNFFCDILQQDTQTLGAKKALDLLNSLTIPELQLGSCLQELK